MLSSSASKLHIRVFAKLAILIQDGGAHRCIWLTRGDNPSKLCLLCKNLFSESSQICDYDGCNLFVCNALRQEDLVPATSADIRNTARYIESKAGTLNVEDFKRLQLALGITHCEHAVLLDRSLDEVLEPTEVQLRSDPISWQPLALGGVEVRARLSGPGAPGGV